MSCSSCQAHVQKAAEGVAGVSRVNVNLLKKCLFKNKIGSSSKNCKNKNCNVFCAPKRHFGNGQWAIACMDRYINGIRNASERKNRCFICVNSDGPSVVFFTLFAVSPPLSDTTAS